MGNANHMKLSVWGDVDAPYGAVSLPPSDLLLM